MRPLSRRLLLIMAAMTLLGCGDDAEETETDLDALGDDGDTGHWEFAGVDWVDGRVTIDQDPNEEVASLVTIILRDHEV